MRQVQVGFGSVFRLRLFGVSRLVGEGLLDDVEETGRYAVSEAVHDDHGPPQ